MLRFIIIGLAIFVAYKLFFNDLKRKKQGDKEASAKEQARKKESGELIKDPVCGSYVSIDDSVTVKDGDKIYHFCSYECRDKYLKQLEQGGREIPRTNSENDEEE
ncbi:transcriptional regulator [Desulfovibrio sp. OttesenSCG-928-C06]|nr:transcriptional regulator [Desulfovibrio sp. OttesenSCG-928-C06]